MNKLTLGIVGNGFVGSSVAHGFNKDVEQVIVDPKYSDTTLKECVDKNPGIIFICVPTPSSETGEIDVSIATTVLQELSNLEYSGIVVVKSTIVAEYLTQFVKDYANLRLVYNPEFLTEASAHWDFCNPSMQILGGDWEDCEVVEHAYVKHSSVKIVPTFKTDIISASLLKYTLNCWFATKVVMMNEFFELHKASGAETSWEQFTDMLARDVRVGNSHLKVPGPDGFYGFGGHCFPKDTSALLHYAEQLDIDMSVLRQAVETNKELRDE